MSEFSHIEITIETVAADGTRTRTTRWTCPSVEMGSTRDRRVQLRFAGEPVVVAGEPATRCPVDGLRYVEGSEPMKPLSDADTAREVMGEISRRYTVTRTLRPGDVYAATCATFDWAGLASEMDAAVAELRRAHAVMQTCDAAPPDPCATEPVEACSIAGLNGNSLAWWKSAAYAPVCQPDDVLDRPGACATSRDIKAGDDVHTPILGRGIVVAAPESYPGDIVRPRLTAYAGTRWRVDSIDGGRANITQIDQPPGSFRCEGVGWAMESLTPVATETPRDVATDPRVGDRVTVGGWLRTVEAVEPGRILVYSGPRFYWRPEEWAFLCQMPGAVIERAPG